MKDCFVPRSDDFSRHYERGTSEVISNLKNNSYKNTIIMNIQTRKIEFIQAFLQIQDEDSISRLEELLNKEREKVQLQPMSIEGFNLRINTSLSDSENDKITENSQLMSEIKQWS